MSNSKIPINTIEEKIDVFYTFDKRIKVVNIRSQSLQNKSGQFAIYVENGSIYETPEFSGYAHGCEHVFFSGTKDMSSKLIGEKFQELTAEDNAYTNNNSTVYHVNFMPWNAFQSIHHLIDMFFNASFEESEIKKEKKIIVEEMNGCHIESEFSEKMDKRLYKWEYCHSGYGSPKTIKSFNRKNMIEYLKNTVSAKNICFVCFGDISTNVLKKEMARIFDSLSSAGIENEFFLDSKKEKNIRSGPVFNENIRSCAVIHGPRQKQAEICITFNPISTLFRERTADSLLFSILGDCGYSVLQEKIRNELGLCYGIFSQENIIRYPDAIIPEISTSVSPKNVAICLENIVSVFEDIKAKGINQRVFEMAKARSISSAIRSLETSYGYMSCFVDTAFHSNDPKDACSVNRYITKINAVTIEQCVASANRFLNKDNYYISILDPRR